MELIQGSLEQWDDALPSVKLRAERIYFRKRRWRATANDGREFGFDLQTRLFDGCVFFQDGAAKYVVEQLPEPVLEIALPGDPGQAARLGWMVGNLHFQLEVVPGAIRLMDDPALRQLCEREGIPYTVRECVFHPLAGGHSH